MEILCVAENALQGVEGAQVLHRAAREEPRPVRERPPQRPPLTTDAFIGPTAVAPKQGMLSPQGATSRYYYLSGSLTDQLRRQASLLSIGTVHGLVVVAYRELDQEALNAFRQATKRHFELEVSLPLYSSPLRSPSLPLSLSLTNPFSLKYMSHAGRSIRPGPVLLPLVARRLFPAGAELPQGGALASEESRR